MTAVTAAPLSDAPPDTAPASSPPAQPQPAPTPRLRAELLDATGLGDAGQAELTLANTGSVADVYRLTAHTELHERALVEPALVRLEPGTSRQVRVTAQAPVAVRVYSQLSGQRASEAFLSR